MFYFVFSVQGRPGPKGDPGDPGLPGQKVSVVLEHGLRFKSEMRGLFVSQGLRYLSGWAPRCKCEAVSQPPGADWRRSSNNSCRSRHEIKRFWVLISLLNSQVSSVEWSGACVRPGRRDRDWFLYRNEMKFVWWGSEFARRKCLVLRCCSFMTSWLHGCEFSVVFC